MHMRRILYSIWESMVSMKLPPESKMAVNPSQDNTIIIVRIDTEVYKITVEKL